MNTTTLENEKIEMINTEATSAAKAAVSNFLGANGEPFYCGFAWVTVRPEHKGNTRLGKAERSILKSIGFEKDWTGKAYQLWNPSGYAGQSMCVKEVGALAYAKVLQEYGFNAYMQSRPD
jgi:hypothetical protein